MKIKLNKKEIHSFGSVRVVSKFLLIPLIIEDEFRWLEKATWEEEFIEIAVSGKTAGKWRPLRWVSEPENFRCLDDINIDVKG